MATQPQPYPGENASAEQLFLLAEEYRKAADVLVNIGRRGKPLSRAPFRLTAIHAIELYLSAYLLIEGEKPCGIRALQHDLEARTKHPRASSLSLSNRTTTHLITMHRGREYLISRYGIDQMHTVSPITRLQATLREVREKVGKRLGIACS
ncbi:hypothetical protein [Pseudorhodoplanes sp.]|uniref:hypothetical protein n=1 Tax=Pseudorhodoplanes sp. TaxID=1934341 RepID=UPI002BB1A526|nr:hypothetical protein [Pseudorhodoplanes sp.]HWV43493.1 hypothetical protein [Pseudorhodoplanes sp.]